MDEVVLTGSWESLWISGRHRQLKRDGALFPERPRPGLGRANLGSGQGL